MTASDLIAGSLRMIGAIAAGETPSAAELSPEYGKQVDPVIAGIAAESKAEIKRQNTQAVYMRGDATGLTTRKPFNWLTGE